MNNIQESKDIKSLARDAKKRLKSGFWQSYKTEVVELTKKAGKDGVQPSRIVEYYESKITNKSNSKDDFYQKVKHLLETEGEVSNAIGRLIESEFYDKLDYQSKQRYILEVSEKYREALARYKRESSLFTIFEEKH